MAPKTKRPNKNNIKKDPVICYCNGIARGVIEAAITRGCNSLPKIFDATMAGVGPCGGSCRPDLARILEHYLNTGTFADITRKKPSPSSSTGGNQ